VRILSTITFRGMRANTSVAEDIERRLNKLVVFCPSMVSARVIVSSRRRRQHGSNRYRVGIAVGVPQREVAITHEPSARQRARALTLLRARKQEEPAPSHRELKVAIRDAFDAARRRLQDYSRLRRHKNGRRPGK
jgi:hypothetical protein